MEKNLKIKTPDKHTIYGILRVPAKKSSTLVVFVHGLVGYANEHIFYNGARFLAKRGVSSFRFDLYTDAPGGRKLHECGISTHAKDLNTVLKYFRKKYKTIFVVGHSLGGPTILMSNLALLDGIIFWDGTSSLKGRLRKDFSYSKKLGKYLITWGVQHTMSTKMHREWSDFPVPSQATRKVTKPFKVVAAGKGILVKAGKEYFKHAKGPKEFAIIEGAYHNFDEDGVEEKLFAETFSFIKKYSK